jgi:hypothetical protein
MPYPLFPSRIRVIDSAVEPVAPDAIPDVRRPRGSRRPHGDARVAQVRRLIEQTTLTYSEISARTGVGRASISRWARDGGWMRPLDAPIATDRMPTVRASQRLKLRKLAERLRLVAERHVRALEEKPEVDVEALMQALQVVKMARLEAMGRRRGRRRIGPTTTGAWHQARDDAIRTALKELQRGGVDLDRAPQDAMDLVLAAHTPAEDHPALRPRGRQRK